MKFIWNKLKIVKMIFVKKPKSINSIKELTKLAVPHLNKIILSILCVLLVNVSQLIKPYILKVVIDDFLIKHTVQTGFYTITTMAILYLVISIFSGLFSYGQVNLINIAGQEIIKDLRRKVFKTIQLLPLFYLDKTSSGRLITRATNDMEEISELFTDVIINLIKDVFLLIGIVYAMVSLNLSLALISFIVIPIMAFIVVVMKNKIKANFHNMKHYIGKINGFMAENISGMKIIQIFRAEKEKEEEFSNLNNEYIKTTLLQVRLNSFLKPASDVFQSLAIAMLIWYSMGKIANHTLEIGVLYAFTTYIKQFFNPISDLADKYNNIQSAFVSTERIFELLEQKDILENLVEGIHRDHIEGIIEFKNVWFSYNNKDWVLKDISFKIEKGQTAAFVGETGAGKTTIISLVNGFYKIQKGEILIDGININTLNLSVLRKNIAVVLQDVFLFSGTIRDNLTLNDQIDDAILQSALEVSCAASFVNTYQKGMLEPVMERGNTLSAGQKQILSFARAIAHNPSIFVLDEATANIDTHTEKLIQKAIENITKERTTLIIAHRLSTIKNANKIIVMKNGEILEMGSNDELIRLNGYYKRMLDAGDCDVEIADFPLEVSTRL